MIHLKRENIKFVIVGDGRYQPEFERQIAELGVGDKFIMIFEGGNLKFRLKSADFTLLSLSFMVVPAKPTTPKPGNPLTKLDSTSTLTIVSVKAALFRDFIFLFVFS